MRNAEHKSALTDLPAKVNVVKRKTFNYFIGIDVSKNELDYAVIYKNDLLFHRELSNKPDAILAFVASLKNLPRFTMSASVFCMEDTGIYGNHLLNTLKDLKANIVVENAFRLKHSMGLVRNKDDKIDSIRIAYYAKRYIDRLKMWRSRREVVSKLMHLMTVRNRLVGVSVALKTPVKAQADFLNENDHKKSALWCEQSRDALEADIKAINQRLVLIVDTDAELKRLFQLVTSVPGIGKLTGIYLLIFTNEFTDFNDPRKFACYAGIAPFKVESGIITSKAKVSHIANKRMKKMLHTCAIVAVIHNPELKAYYKRKLEDGKSKMSVLNAVRNKLVLRVFACVKQNRIYDKDYIPGDLS
ncbi:IS110 family transposase [Mucilaginibacter sp.]|uniref:IS110 family transposase n=1 Tax=Mucilaginibacter sp. TaxID=1882438 RepID=UPI002637246A|nr:IS110 family transposase [Mucilaginibacter sp.]MDB4923557.1 Transposase [Mucilaginibacter sp.]